MDKVSFAVSLDFLAKRYSVLPSQLMTLDIVDLSFNFDVATEGAIFEKAQMDEAGKSVSARSSNIDLPSKEELELYLSSLPEDSKLRMMTIGAKR